MLVTLTGASGVGKTAIMRRLMSEDREMIPLRSTTTRKWRTSDVGGGFEYITEPVFVLMRREEIFLWTVEIHGNHYGTRRHVVEAAFRSEAHVLASVAHSAVMKLHAFAQRFGKLDQIRSMFIESPGEDVLRARLDQRGDYSADINRRIVDCLSWDLEAQSSSIPYVFHRDDNDLEKKFALVRDLLTRV